MAIHPNEVLRRSRARSSVRSGIVARKITREPCEICGDPDVEAHHEDYTKPLEVHWLCSAHHRALHRIRLQAESYGKAVEIVKSQPLLISPAKSSRMRVGYKENEKARKIVKARIIAGTVCVTLPKLLRDALQIDEGTNLMISLDRRNNRLVITKE